MDPLLLAVAIVGLVILVAWVLSYRATRIDRLHARIEGCWHALDAVLVRRSEALLELANAGVLDPASSLLLTDAVSDVLELGDVTRDERIAHENALADTASLVFAEASPDTLAEVEDPLRGTVERAARQVDVAASFYNEAVSDVVAIRDQWITKVACLAGKAPRHHTLDVRGLEVGPLVAAGLVDDDRSPAP